MNTINLYLISGLHFREIFYSDINNLKKILNKLLKDYNSYQFIQLILNGIIINDGTEENNYNFYKINKLNKTLNDNDIIQVVFISKNSLFFIKNNDNYILNTKYSYDNYYKLITYVSDINNLYNIIINKLYKNIVIDLMLKNSNLLQYVSIDMRNDYDVILAAVNSPLTLDEIRYSENPSILHDNNISKNEYNILLTCINSPLTSGGLRYASYKLKNNKDIVFQAIYHRGLSLYYASNKLKNNKEVVLYAVKQNSSSLHFASDILKNDKDIVLLAVKQDGLTLHFASTRLKNDKDVVLIAVKQNSLALNFASTRLKNDKDIILITKTKYI